VGLLFSHGLTSVPPCPWFPASQETRNLASTLVDFLPVDP